MAEPPPTSASPRSPAHVRIVLLRPRWASNLGAVARAMQNFGLADLTLVDSRIGSWADAWRMAVQAGDVLANARQVADLDEVLGPATWVVGTTNEPPPGARVLTPRQVAAEITRHQDAVLLFGGEIDGLFARELLRCHAVATIPTASSQSSLNLAQAVCVFAAELCAARRAELPREPGPVPLATAAMMQHLERLLHELLAGSAWADANRGKNALAELLQPLWRAQLTEPELRAWLVALNKAAQL